MDEFHYYADPERGWAWQVPLIELPQAQFLLMSATLGDVTFFAEDLTRRTGRETAVVAHTERPVPLSFRYARDAAARDDHRAPRRAAGAGLRRAHHAGRGDRAGAGPDEPQRLLEGREGADRRAHRRVPLHRRVRQDALAAGAPRHRRAPRRDAAEVPAPRGDAGPGRAAQAHLRHRHARRRDQRPDPHGAVHRADQVRRPAGAPPAGPRVPPGRRARGTRRARRRGLRRRPGPRARGGERQAARQGRRRRQEAAARRAGEAARRASSRGRRRPSRSSSRRSPRR